MAEPNNRATTLDEVLASAAEILFPHLDEPTIDVYSKSSDGDTALHVAVWRRDAEAVRILLEAGAKVDEPGDMGATPLFAAVAQDSVDVAGVLLNNGANPDAGNELNSTPRESARLASQEIQSLFSEHRS